MNEKEIIKQLEWYHEGVFPRRALRAAVAHKEEVTPHLLKILEEATQHIDKLLLDATYMGHIYALYLLAQFRETRAYPLIVNFFSLPGELSLDVTGDIVTEDLRRILASVCGGDVTLIKQVAENRALNEDVRNAALYSLVCLVAVGERSREEVLDYYKGLFHHHIPREQSLFWSSLVACCTDLYPEEVYDEIKQAFADGLVEEFYITLEEVEQTLSLGKEEALRRLEKGNNGLIDDTIKELEGWAAFTEPTRQVAVGKTKKVGRNDPCPCRSGRKYKKCCGR